MSILKDAVTAMKTVLLLEERIASQSKKLEQLADRMVEMERRLAVTEGRMEGFLAGAAAFSGSRAAPRDGNPAVIDGKSAEPTTPALDDKHTR